MCSCTDGLGRSCMILALLDMMLNPDLPALLAVEHVRQVRGPGAVKTIKVSKYVTVSVFAWTMYVGVDAELKSL